MKVYINKNCALVGSRGVKEYYMWLVELFGPCNSVDDVNIEFKEFSRSRILQLFFWTKNVTWSPSHATSVLNFNHVVTVHDLINMDNCISENRWFRFFFIYLNLMFVFLFSRSIVCISQYTQSRVISFFPFVSKKTIVIRSPRFVEVLQSEELPLIVKNVNYILVVSNSLPHKNVRFILDNFLEPLGNSGLKLVLISDHRPLVVCGVDNLIYLDDVSDCQMNALFANAFAVLSPSFAEGHNIVLAKASYLGKPILASDIPVHREYYPSSYFFNPACAVSLINGLEALLVDKKNVCDLKVEESKEDFINLKKSYLYLFKSMK